MPQKQMTTARRPLVVIEVDDVAHVVQVDAVVLVEVHARVQLLDLRGRLSSSARNVRGFGDSGTWMVRGISSPR